MVSAQLKLRPTGKPVTCRPQRCARPVTTRQMSTQPGLRTTC